MLPPMHLDALLADRYAQREVTRCERRPEAYLEIETDDTALPQPIIDAILPQAVRGNEVMAQFGMIEEIKADRSVPGEPPLLSAIADGTFGLMKRPADAGRGLDGVAALKGWSGITTAAWAGSIPLVLLAGWLL